MLQQRDLLSLTVTGTAAFLSQELETESVNHSGGTVSYRPMFWVGKQEDVIGHCGC